MSCLRFASKIIGIAMLTGCATAPARPQKAPMRPPSHAKPSPADATPPEASKKAAPVVAPEKTTVTFEELALTFELPSAAWKRHPVVGPPSPGVAQIGFEREELYDTAGNAVRPFCGIMTELVPPEQRDIIQYSVSWRLRVPFKVDAVFSHESGPLQLKNAIGYRGRKSYGNTEHSLIVVHGLFRDRGFVISCDATTAVLPQVQGEFEALLHSMKHSLRATQRQ